VCIVEREYTEAKRRRWRGESRRKGEGERLMKLTLVEEGESLLEL